MDLRAEYEKQQEARWRVFLMFIVMALLIIRAGLLSRKRREQPIFFPPAPALKRQDLSADERTLSPGACPSPDELYCATLVVLVIAELAGDLYRLNAREIWDLMNQPPFQPVPERTSNVAGLFGGPSQRLDTS
jgi:hypothetical protein